MRESMESELCYFFATVLFGIAAACLYHLLMLFRAVFRHGTSLVDAEDILFFGCMGPAFFYVVYCCNDGILRWYAFAGAALGVLLYQKTVASLLEPVRKWLLQKRQKTIKIRKKRKQEDGESEIEGITSQSKPKKRKKENGTVHYRRSGDGAVRRYCLQQRESASGEEGKGTAVQ